MSLTLPRRWLGDDGALLHGKWRGELLEDVAREHRSYLQWLVDTVDDINEVDRECIVAMLAHSTVEPYKRR